jgi:pilus assembly protein Flp/PilA
MQNLFARFVKDESGATAIEYGLIAAIIGVGIIAGLQGLKSGITGTLTNAANGMAVAAN